MKDPAIYLEHVLESIELIEQYLEDVDLETFLESVEKQDAVLSPFPLSKEDQGLLPHRLYTHIF